MGVRVGVAVEVGGTGVGVAVFAGVAVDVGVGVGVVVAPMQDTVTGLASAVLVLPWNEPLADHLPASSTLPPPVQPGTPLRVKSTM